MRLGKRWIERTKDESRGRAGNRAEVRLGGTVGWQQGLAFGRGRTERPGSADGAEHDDGLSFRLRMMVDLDLILV